MSASKLDRWLQKKNVADATTIEDEFNHWPQLKQTMSKWFRVVLAVVMAVGMFVIPIQTVNATPNIQFTDSGQDMGNSDSRGVSLGDVDGDGDTDAFVANFSDQPNKVWLNDGSGNFYDSGQALGNSKSWGVSLGDVDGDGDTDAFVTSWGTPNKVWLNDGSGKFYDSGQALGNNYSYSVSLGDVDGDGDTDAFVANVNYFTNSDHSNKVWLNDGSGKFYDSGQALGSSWSYSASLGDVDGDGDTDAFVANNAQPNKVWLNDGRGKFYDSGQALGNSLSNGVSLGDVDGDGDTDAFVANAANDGQPNKVWLNDGSGKFYDSGQALGNYLSNGVSLEDVDGDGDTDAFVANTNGQPNKVWLNDGSGKFTDSGLALGHSSSQGVSLEDVDGDGDTDAFVANQGPNEVWLNNSTRNIPPNLANPIPNQTATANQPFSFTIPSNTFSDPDGDSLTLSATLANGSALPSWLNFNPSTNTLSGTPTATDVGNISIKITANDGHGGTASASFTLTIVRGNQPPVVSTPIPDQTATANQPFSFTIPSNTFSDPDGNSLTLSATLANGSALPSWLSFNSSTNTLSGTPATSDVGTLSINITANDGHGHTTSDSFTLTILRGNQPPVVNTPIPDQTATTGSPFNFTIPRNTFSDPDGDSLSLSATLANGSALPSWLNFNSSTNTLSGTPAISDVGTLSIKITANDGHGGTANASFTLTIVRGNQPPVVRTPIPNQTATVNQAFSFTIPTNTFSDPDGDSLSLSATLANGSALPSWLSFNSSTNTLSGTPATSDVGNISIKVTANDGHGGTISDSFALTIKQGFTPIIINIDATKNNEDNPVIQSLPPGNYKTHLISKSDGGEFDAWNDTGLVQGCDANGDNCKYGWEARYYVKPSYHKVADTSCSQPRFGSCRYSTPAKAVANYPADVDFSVSTQQNVTFYIYDSVGLSNNQGGISLEILKQ